MLKIYKLDFMEMQTHLLFILPGYLTSSEDLLFFLSPQGPQNLHNLLSVLEKKKKKALQSHVEVCVKVKGCHNLVIFSVDKSTAVFVFWRLHIVPFNMIINAQKIFFFYSQLFSIQSNIFTVYNISSQTIQS